MSQINLYNRDCMEAMADMQDNAYDLAIVDPPYGTACNISKGGGSHTKSKVKFHQSYSENQKKWNIIPSDEYFNELKRVSKNQIIWGGNYFSCLGKTRGFIIWDKPEMRIATMSNCEFAWTSFDCPAKIIPISRGFKQPTFHPTKKPIKLYQWLLKNYAKPGDKILDTHGGSMSIAIACHDLGFDLDGFEIDKDYYEAAIKRFNLHKSQMQIQF